MTVNHPELFVDFLHHSQQKKRLLRSRLHTVQVWWILYMVRSSEEKECIFQTNNKWQWMSSDITPDQGFLFVNKVGQKWKLLLSFYWGNTTKHGKEGLQRLPWWVIPDTFRFIA